MKERENKGQAPRSTPPNRSERLAAALRANLKRRKAQARGRADRAEPVDEADNRLKRPHSDTGER
jgi:hypothetical protein